MIKAILTKPLDGHPEGTELEFDKNDFAQLQKLGAVRAAPQIEADKPDEPAEPKAAPVVLNKMAEPVLNKTVPAASDIVRNPKPKA